MGGLSDSQLDELLRAGEAAWPGVRPGRERFAGAFSAAIASGAALSEIHAADLFLVTGCLEKRPEALTAFEENVMRAVRPAIERACRNGGDPDDAAQSTREKLLVGGPGMEPKLAQYTGRGPLVGWVRVIAVREALQAKRKVKREIADDAGLVDGGGSRGPSIDLSLLRRLHGPSVKAAIEKAIARLTPEQRTVLRFHVKDGLSIDRIGALLGIHRATAARRLERARIDALAQTEAILREAHGLSESEAKSLCVALGDAVDASIARALDEVRA